MVKKPSQLKVALVHDFLREYGGGERVLEELHRIFPQAPVYVAFVDVQSLGNHWQRFADWDIRQTWFSKIPLHKKIFSPLRFLVPHAFTALDLSDYDVVISSSNAFEAKAVNAPNGTHFCYCHTPPRALYGYSTMSNWKKNPVIKFFGQLINHYMRVVDFKQAQKVDIFIANSEETRVRIKKFYHRQSTVIHPPVQVAADKKELLAIKRQSQQDCYFYINRLGLQKHPELAVQACLDLNLKLKIAGAGPMLDKLKQMATKSVNGGQVEFLGMVTDKQLARLYAGAKALLYPVEDEDFGMVPVEAMMAGTPVIAHRSGGPQYTIQSQINGILFDELSTNGLKQAIKKFERLFAQQVFKPEAIQQLTQPYTQSSFSKHLSKIIKERI